MTGCQRTKHLIQISFPINRVSAIDLRPACDTRLHLMAAVPVFLYKEADSPSKAAAARQGSDRPSGHSGAAEAHQCSAF